jgi:quinol monooxygenase YgiN
MEGAMSSNTVRVIATLIAREGKADELASCLRNLILPTRAEPGCRRYELWQNEADSNEFRFVEEWESSAALDAHFETPHIQNALSQLPELMAGELDLRKYQLLA